MNTVTPRLFIAATEQNTGKTTTALGLYQLLRARYARIGFIKPVGQRFVQVEGHRIDEDSLLIRDTYNTQVPIEAMSPIAVEPDFTRRYINGANHEALVRRIRNAFDRACWEKDFTLIEGTGHAGVGSVFDLSNARIAGILRSKVILITPGGIGRPIDEAALNKALFDRAGVDVIGVVMNKVLPSKMAEISEVARKGFKRIGLELLGMIPRVEMLAVPTLEQIREALNAKTLYGEEQMGRHAERVVIGAMSAANATSQFTPETLLIIPGDRENILVMALLSSNRLAGVILSDGLKPSASVLSLMEHSSLPIMMASGDCYEIASRIHSMTVKTLPADHTKIARIQEEIGAGVDVNRILEKLTSC
jgi:BioD-like phosphotransacetylase family protein